MVFFTFDDYVLNLTSSSYPLNPDYYEKSCRKSQNVSSSDFWSIFLPSQLIVRDVSFTYGGNLSRLITLHAATFFGVARRVDFRRRRLAHKIDRIQPSIRRPPDLIAGWRGPSCLLVVPGMCSAQLHGGGRSRVVRVATPGGQ